MSGIKLLLIDDHHLFREGLTALFKGEPDLEIAGHAPDVRSGCALAETVTPDVIILDIALQGSNGIVGIPDLLRAAPSSRVLMLTVYGNDESVLAAFSAGASGFALKEQPAAEVVGAIRTVASGGRYLAPRLAPVLRDAERKGLAVSSLEALSPRERQVFDLAVRGFSNASIARQLFISIKTVETHRAHINRKLGAHSVADLIRFAVRHQFWVE